MPIFYDIPYHDIWKIFAPKFDGTYVEDDVKHRTWLATSDDDTMLYMIDRNEQTGETICTCAGNSYKGRCKHIDDLETWGEQ